MSKLTVSKIENLNSFVLRQSDGNSFFISTPNNIIFSVPSFVFILKFLLFNNYLPHQVIEGLMEEYYSDIRSGDVK
jgi:hypothetical protein